MDETTPRQPEPGTEQGQVPAPLPGASYATVWDYMKGPEWAAAAGLVEPQLAGLDGHLPGNVKMGIADVVWQLDNGATWDYAWASFTSWAARLRWSDPKHFDAWVGKWKRTVRSIRAPYTT